MPATSLLQSGLSACGIPGPYDSFEEMAGGCISRVYRVATGSGSVCVKLGSGHADQFLREREGLEALAAAGTGLRIPKVLGCQVPDSGPAILVLEYLEPGPPRWEELGRGLAALHRRAESRFGFARDNYLGSTPQENGWMDDWPSFYSRRRLEPMMRRLEDAGLTDSPRRILYARLLGKIPALLAHGPQPSLLHGDLWNGNFLPTAQGPALIDPAAYYGDREAEWAMMRLFGGFPEAVLAAYQEVFPLPPDWMDRQPLYQLYHLLNHQLLFGGGYGSQAFAAAKRYV